MISIDISTSKSQEIIDITDLINSEIKKAKFKSGICYLFCPHTTCAISINEGADPSVKKDIINKLNKVIEVDDNYSHLEGNSHAHIKSVLIGNSLNIIVENGELKLGTWQSVYICEFDGPRKRKVWMKFIPD